jgi:predicted ribosome quality control (RQC) complex YloA/Tae2 family protein
VTSNYYTLAAVIREISPSLVGATDDRSSIFLEAYSHRPNELRLHFDRGTLVALLRPIDGALFLSSTEEKKPRSNVRSFFEELHGQPLQAISIAEDDRLITLHFPSAALHLRYFGAPNALLIKDGETAESFKKQVEERSPIEAGSVKSGSKLGKRYTKEAEARAQATGKSVKESIAQLQSELASADSAIIYRKGDEALLSLTSLSSLSEWSSETVSSINDAVRRTVIDRSRGKRVAGVRSDLLRRIDSELERHYRARNDMRQGVENSRRSERYAAIANALMMHAHELPKGAEEVVLPIEERDEKIVLDPLLNPFENAGRYFERSKNSLKSREELKSRVETTSKEIARLEALRQQVDEESDIDKLLKLRTPTNSKPDPRNPIPGFREFIVFGGMKVLVGKNARQNDELTTRVAKKEDVWLHARGVPGSHVVLQIGSRKDVPKEAIEQAAEIAAWYSDARSQPLAPVSYTRKKYVRKPKGANPGSVMLEREEVMMVRPAMPTT